MKNGPIKLLYHSMHKRPMRGCLPLFFFPALLVVGMLVWVVDVKTTEPRKSRGTGRVLYRDDSVTRFYIAQHSALPLRMPMQVDPAVQPPVTVPELPLQREVELEMAPPVFPFASDLNSTVFDSEILLELPPTNAPTEDGRGAQP